LGRIFKEKCRGHISFPFQSAVIGLLKKITNSTLAEIFRALNNKLTAVASFITLVFAASCGDPSGQGSRGAIQLGDPSTIVTETDSQYLRDDVMDIEPRSATRDSVVVAVQAAPKPKAADTSSAPKPQPQVKEAGYTIAFNDTKIVLTGLQLKDGRRQNPERDNGLTYTLGSGNLPSARLMVYGAKNVTVKQRYQSQLMLKSALGQVDLRDLGLYTSGWNTLPAGNSGEARAFNLNSLNNITYSAVTNDKIKRATDRELRNRRTSSRTIQNWMKEIRRVRSAQDKPCDIILDNVQWQISGTDAKGKPFQKTVRLDV
jgi:hypothetical protein